MKRATLYALPLLLAGCVPEYTSLAPEDIEAEPIRGAMLFAENCAACHGTDGSGAGAASLGLGAPPPDLTDLSARNGGEFPRDYIMSVLDGADRAGDPDAVMPGFGDAPLGALSIPAHDKLSDPVPQDLIALTDYIESLQAQ